MRLEIRAAGITEGVGFIRYLLLAFAGIALAYDTLSITLAQRMR